MSPMSPRPIGRGLIASSSHGDFARGDRRGARRRARRRRRGAPGAHPPGEVRRVSGHPGQGRGGHGVHEVAPDHVEAGYGVHHAPVLHHRPVLVESREVDPRQVVPVPRAPDDVRHVEHVAVRSDRRPVADVDHPTDPRDAGGVEVDALRADQRRGAVGELRQHAPSDRSPERQHVQSRESHDGQHEPRRRAAVAHRQLAGRRAGDGRGVRAAHVERDLGARVAHPDDEHAARPQLLGIPVVTRVELQHGCPEPAGQLGHPRRRVAARGEHHVLGFPAACTGFDDEPVADPANPIHVDARAHGQPEVRRVRLQVVGLLVLRREPEPVSGERQALEAVVLGRCEQVQGVPAQAPRIADALVRVEDHEVAVLLRQVVGDRESGLPAADDDGVEHAAGFARDVRCLVHGPDATATPRGPRRVDPPFAREGAGGFHPGAVSRPVRAGRRTPLPPTSTTRRACRRYC